VALVVAQIMAAVVLVDRVVEHPEILVEEALLMEDLVGEEVLQGL
jgi:hypothetical protein